MRSLITSVLLLGSCLATQAHAQTMPYTILGTLDQAAKECQGNEFVTGYLRITHFKPEDKRPFVLTLKAPGISKVVEVKEDGEVILPALSRGVWKDATVSHNLEKGALSLGFWFRFKGSIDNFSKGQKSVFDCLEEIKAGPQKELRKIAKIGTVLPPEMRNSTFAVAGLSVFSDGKQTGKVNLLRQGVVVQTCDLSKPGKTVWMFDAYDPKAHSVSFEGNDETKPTVVDFVPALAAKDKLPANSVEIVTFNSVE